MPRHPQLPARRTVPPPTWPQQTRSQVPGCRLRRGPRSTMAPRRTSLVRLTLTLCLILLRFRSPAHVAQHTEALHGKGLRSPGTTRDEPRMPRLNTSRAHKRGIRAHQCYAHYISPTLHRPLAVETGRHQSSAPSVVATCSAQVRSYLCRAALRLQAAERAALRGWNRKVLIWS